MSSRKCTLTNRVGTIQEPKAEIIRVIADVQQDIRKRVIGNFIEHVNTCRLSGVAHFMGHPILSAYHRERIILGEQTRRILKLDSVGSQLIWMLRIYSRSAARTKIIQKTTSHTKSYSLNEKFKIPPFTMLSPFFFGNGGDGQQKFAMWATRRSEIDGVVAVRNEDSR
ncbi:hypothetical protein NQ318_022252 [Aromia moschata]|uniref:Ribosomal protein S3 n=1 Tax=Aromia moschata TaxID=1265417 RepID=A0AAV8XFY5_9CUCU|nr:hypothetical protein NQ318_022252 [Aromia moschata]